MEQKINHSKPHYWSYLSVSDLLVTRSQQGHSFYNTAWPKKPHSFFEPQLTQHYKKYTSSTQPKSVLTLQIIHQKRFWLVSEKNICTTPFLDAQKQYSWSTWKANVYLFKNILALETQEVFLWCGAE